MVGGASSYALTVNSGTGSGSYAAGSIVELVAASAPSGQEFDRWTGDVGNVANVNAATTTLTMPAADATVTATYRAASAGGTFSFVPTDDAYLQGTTRFNDAYVKVEAGNRVSYLKFNVSGLSGSVGSATLQLRENGDVGSGTLRVYRGSHNSWTETSLSTANAPGENGQLGTFTGAVSGGQAVSVDVSSLITGDGIYSVIVKMDAGGNDIWFGSEESTRKPQLIIETEGSGGAVGLSSSSYASELEATGEESVSAANAQDPLMSGTDDSRNQTALQRMAFIPPQPPLLRVARVGPAEVELGWQVNFGAGCQIQVRSSLSEGEWTTVFTTAGPTGSVRVPIAAETTGAYFRIIRVGRPTRIQRIPWKRSAATYEQMTRFHMLATGGVSEGPCRDGFPLPVAAADFLFMALAHSQAAEAVVTGELKQWHKVTLTFDGPETSESASPNSFLDYRLDVTFSQGSKSIRVPGYYAADGDAANTSASSGNKWRVNFTPDETGTWSWSASFRAGAQVAIDLDPMSGVSAGYFDAETGTLEIAESDKTGRDFRAEARGRLEYVGEHALRWRGSGDYFFKVGLNHPEVFLEYADFDNTASTRTYDAHLGDWQLGDPTWQETKGQGIVGVVNYLSVRGMNVHYFIVMNSQGDGKQAFPWNASEDVWNYDVSKLDQWQIVTDHMMSKGVMAHILLTEQENQSLFEYLAGWPASGFADSRKLFFREMVARFGHLNALTWNIGEESGMSRGSTYAVGVTDAQRKAFADWMRGLTYYDDHIVVHNGPWNNDTLFLPLFGHAAFSGLSYQGDIFSNRPTVTTASNSGARLRRRTDTSGW